MCDTLVALGSATVDGSVILAKNSDRAPNEAQYPVFFPRTQHREATVRCTHIEIPQVGETFAVLLSKPFWMWGCEMGANEFGVVIGNEAVWTKEPIAKTGLLGMDLIRLALERADTARGALDVITDLLTTHGQGGVCDIHYPSASYHNSFLIADPGAAWVLETADRYWAAKKVEDVYSISNLLTIGAEFDLASPGLVEHAVERRWCAGKADFHFARCYSGLYYTRIAYPSRARQRRTSERLHANQGEISPEAMFGVLRDHGKGEGDPSWSPSRPGRTVCMHAADKLKRRSQSTASLVAHLRPGMPVYWMTGTSGPCTGLFKPFYMAPLPHEIGTPTGEYDAETQWWAHERLHRAVLQDYATRVSVYQKERDGLEAAFLREEQDLYERYRDAPLAERADALAEYVQLTYDRAAVATARWEDRVKATPVRHKPNPLYCRYWRKQNRIAKFPRSRT
jgi:secernin